MDAQGNGRHPLGKLIGKRNEPMTKTYYSRLALENERFVLG
jgi:hypothetical protein